MGKKGKKRSPKSKQKPLVRNKPRGNIREQRETSAISAADLWWRRLSTAWIILVALTPLTAPLLFRSHITDSAAGTPIYGYTPELCMAIWLQVLSMVTICVCMFSVFRWRQWRSLNDPLFICASLFVLWASLSTLWSFNLYESMDKLSYWLAGWLGLFILLQAVRGERELFFCMRLIFFSVAGTAIFGIGQYLAGWNWLSQAIPPAASFGNKNFAAQYCLLGAPLAWVLMAHAKYELSRWLYAFLGALVLVFLFYTKTRAAWLSLILQFLILLCWLFYELYRHRQRWLQWRTNGLPVAFACMIVVAGIQFKSGGNFGLDVPKLVTQRFESIVEDSAKGSRLPIYLNTLHQIKDHRPLTGVGIGNWYVFYPFYQQYQIPDVLLKDAVATRHAHNDLLQLTAELGFVGLALILATLFCFFRGAWRLLHSEQSWRRLYCAGIVASLGGMALDSMFSSPFQRPLTVYVMMLLLGVMVFMYQQERRNDVFRALSVSAARRAAIAGVACVALLGAVVWGEYRLLVSNHHYWKAKHHVAGKRHREALAEAKQAYEYNPSRKRLLNIVGGMQLSLENYKAAIDTLEEARSGYPYMQHSLRNLATAYRHEKQFEEAIEITKVLEKNQPLDASNKITLAKLYRQAGDRQQALEWAREALDSERKSAAEEKQAGLLVKQYAR